MQSAGRGPLSFLAQVSSTCPTLCPQIQESEHIKVENSENGSKLTIRAARQEHCGCYTLLVENKLGSRQAQVNLTVVGEWGDRAQGRWDAGPGALSHGAAPPARVPSALPLPALTPLLPFMLVKKGFAGLAHTVPASPAFGDPEL